MLTQETFCSFVGEVLEPFDLKFQVYDVREDCTTLELGKKEIPGYNPSQGLGYYEFTQAEYISLNAKVMLMNQVHSTAYILTIANNGIYGFSTRLFYSWFHPWHR